MPLTDRQARFVDEYLIDLNATAAARRAGYSADSAQQLGSRQLCDPDVQAAIAEAQARTRAKLEVTREMIAEEQRKCGFANMMDYLQIGPDGDPVLNFAGLTREQAAALAEVTVEDFKDGRGEDARDVRRVKFKLVDKLRALDSLSKLLGFDKQVHIHANPDGTPLFEPFDPQKASIALLGMLGPVLTPPKETSDETE